MQNKYYSIKWAGGKTHKIITFKKSFMEKLLKSEDYAIRLLIDTLTTHLQKITGLKYTLDWDQHQQLDDYGKSICFTVDTLRKHYILTILEYGIKAYPNNHLNDLDEFLDLLNYLVKTLLKEKTNE